MSSEDTFDDKPLADVDEQAVAKALDSERVFERSSAPPRWCFPQPLAPTSFQTSLNLKLSPCLNLSR